MSFSLRYFFANILHFINIEPNRHTTFSTKKLVTICNKGKKKKKKTLLKLFFLILPPSLEKGLH